MTHRTDWKVLRHSDPIQGNVTDIHSAADNYKAISEAISKAQSELQRITDKAFTTEMISEAVAAVRSDATTVNKGLQVVQGRYSVVAKSLSEYADTLAVAQTSADDAERDAQNAKQALDEANSRLSQLAPQVSLIKQLQVGFDQVVASADVADLTGAKEAAQENSDALGRAMAAQSAAKSDQLAAQARIDAAEAKLNAAIKQRDDAARSAATAITHACSEDGLNNNLFMEILKGIGDFVLNVAEALATAVADVFKGLAEVVVALEHLMTDQAQLFDALMHGDWGRCSQILGQMVNHTLDLMAGLSVASKGLSVITGTVGAVLDLIPITAPIGHGLGFASMAFAGISLGLDAGLVAFGKKDQGALISDALDLSLSAISNIPVAGDFAKAAQDTLNAELDVKQLTDDGGFSFIGSGNGSTGLSISVDPASSYVYRNADLRPDMTDLADSVFNSPYTTGTQFMLASIDTLAVGGEDMFNGGANAINYVQSGWDSWFD